MTQWGIWTHTRKPFPRNSGRKESCGLLGDKGIRTNIMPQPYDRGKHRLCDYLQCRLAPGLENVMLKLCGRGDQIGPDPKVRRRRDKCQRTTRFLWPASVLSMTQNRAEALTTWAWMPMYTQTGRSKRDTSRGLGRLPIFLFLVCFMEPPFFPFIPDGIKPEANFLGNHNETAEK